MSLLQNNAADRQELLTVVERSWPDTSSSQEIGKERVKENHNSAQQETSCDVEEDKKASPRAQEKAQTLHQQTQNQQDSRHLQVSSVQWFVRPHSTCHPNLVQFSWAALWAPSRQPPVKHETWLEFRSARASLASRPNRCESSHCHLTLVIFPGSATLRTSLASSLLHGTLFGAVMRVTRSCDRRQKPGAASFRGRGITKELEALKML